MVSGLRPTERVATPRRFKPYSAYKDSGVGWLGKIPAHWELKRLKFVVVLNPPTSELRGLARDTDVSFVPMEAVGEYGGLELSRTKPLGDVSAAYTYFRDGDVIVAKITPCFENGKGALAAGLTNGIAFGTTELHVFRATPALHGRFLFYLTLCDAFRRLGEADMHGAGGQKRVSESFFKNLKHPLPNPDEQRAIAAFLDRETARIDGLVAKKERLIELLQEQRTALITHAVTKGLDPNTPMKDSGVEWLGEIPAHWEVKRLKDVVPGITVGIVVTPSKYYVEEGVPCLRSLNIAQGVVTMRDLVFISPTANELHRKSKIFTGDVLVVRTGKAGTAVVVPPELDGVNCIDLLIIRRSKLTDSRFLYHFINSLAALRQVELRSVGAIQDHYNTGTLAELWLAGMPVTEQRAIATFLDQEAARIDALVAKVREAIDRLKEFRTALISAAVTGKIDLREIA